VDEWRLFWTGAGGTPDGDRDDVLGAWGDLAKRERALGIRPGQPILLAPDGRVDFTEAQPLAGHLTVAALLTIGYLSGMRPEEILHLERGCSHQEEREDGTVRYRVTGRHFKGITDADGNTLPGGEIRPELWTVIEPVDCAVKVLEQLHDDRLLFPRSLTVRTLQPTQAVIRAEGLNPNRFIGRIKAFIDWANATATRLDRPHELTPADPHGPITLRRLRRTLAWFIYRRPGGRIALGLQYGHVGTSWPSRMTGAPRPTCWRSSTSKRPWPWRTRSRRPATDCPPARRSAGRLPTATSPPRTSSPPGTRALSPPRAR
jgi:hypothetical protein